MNLTREERVYLALQVERAGHQMFYNYTKGKDIDNDELRMYRKDVEDLMQVATLIRKSKIADAARKMQNMDTAARDLVPKEVINKIFYNYYERIK